MSRAISLTVRDPSGLWKGSFFTRDDGRTMQVMTHPVLTDDDHWQITAIYVDPDDYRWPETESKQ